MKSSYICSLFVFGTLIASAQSSTCSKCWAVGDTECCGDKTIECPGSSCMTISEYCILGDKESRTIRRTCGDNTTCGICFSVTTNKGLTVLASSQCGTGDKSNADLNYQITCKALENENGLSCPACYLNNSMDGCEATDRVKCRGAETECVDYAGKVQISDGEIQAISAQGCIMKNGCAIGFAGLPGAKQIKENKFTCRPADKD
ncbi:phospholipase A2 inhibitor PIP-like isoform X1 [Dendropsophus ebraccatus]|uniref:phospholipase A2 inhibitor PIP-like isoform X1 n=1 Tax=Dendropsophus ebraccatus TaxID=150705 RepID=UPI0038316307